MSKETVAPTLTREALLAFLGENKEWLAKGKSAEEIVDQAFAGQFELKIRERLESKKSDDVTDEQTEEMVRLTVEYAEKFSAYIKTTEGTPNGNAQTKFDREQVEFSTALGTMKVRIDHDL